MCFCAESSAGGEGHVSWGQSFVALFLEAVIKYLGLGRDLSEASFHQQ